MKYLNYSIQTLYWAERNGDFAIVDFFNLISDLLNFNILTHDTEIGVANYINKNGTGNLSEKQIFVLNLILKKYARVECERCCSKIPIYEVANSFVNGGYCDFCFHEIEKDD